MINIENKDKKQEKPVTEQSEQVKPDEQGGFVFTGFFKISDPDTGEIIMQGRA